MTRFNPRPRTGGDTQIESCLRSSPSVSIRAPARGATKSVYLSSLYRLVSIRAPARGATPHLCDPTGSHRVSIRAPARGATPQGGAGGPAGQVSIRAPARGATKIYGIFIDIYGSFNPRPRTGGDFAPRPGPWLCVRVSIRAPARGATHFFHVRPESFIVSIRAPARGATARSETSPPPFPVSIRAPARGATVSYLTSCGVRTSNPQTAILLVSGEKTIISHWKIYRTRCQITTSILRERPGENVGAKGSRRPYKTKGPSKSGTVFAP